MFDGGMLPALPLVTLLAVAVLVLVGAERLRDRSAPVLARVPVRREWP